MGKKKRTKKIQQMQNKKFIVECKMIFAVLVLGVCLSGCKRKEVEYIGDDIHSETNADAGGNSYHDPTGDLREKLGVEELWQESVGDSSSTSIYVRPIVPEVKEMKVISAKRKYFDAEVKKDFLSRFAEGNVYLYGEGNVPKEDIEKEILKLEKYIAWEETGDSIGESQQGYIDSLYEDLDTLRAQYEKAPENFKEAQGSYTDDTYLTEYNDMDYIVYFAKNTYENLFWQVSLKDFGEIQKGRSYDRIDTAFMEKKPDSVVENLCSITKEQAEALALDFVSMFDVGEFTVGDSYPLCFIGQNYGDEKIDEWCDGYTVVLYRSIDGVRVVGETYDRSVVLSVQADEYSDSIWSEGYVFAGYEKIIACVNDSGVVKMQYYNPLLLENVEVEDVELLSYNNIKEAILMEIERWRESEYGIYGGDTFHNMELLYFPLKNAVGADDYTIIPVWQLTNGYYYNEITSYVMVNAIDGSIINLGEQSLIPLEEDHGKE